MHWKILFVKLKEFYYNLNDSEAWWCIYALVN